MRSGHHCAQPILRRMGVESTVRRWPSTIPVRISMRWSPHSCVFKLVGGIVNVSWSEKMFHLVPATVLDPVIDVFYNPV